jgi:N-acetylglucosaminyldiphosphoundecaprenol N-acetyl-beta-D-mannosaminyltransferase
MGVPVDSVTEVEAIGCVLAALAERRGGWIVTPNIDILRQAAYDASIRTLITSADLILADGMPLLWASRLLHRPLPARVPGSALIWSLSEAAGRTGASVFLLGGSPGVAERAAAVLQSTVPQLHVSGHHCPPFGFENSPTAMRELIERLETGHPDIVFCGLGFPKQERLISQLRERFPSTWFLGIGISLSFVAGEIRRCPQWMQDIGLEWLHRLSCEPRRLFSRYVMHDLPFAVILLAQAAIAGRAARG